MHGKQKSRMLVISNYSIVIIRRSKIGKKKVSYEAHLFNLSGLSIVDKDRIRVKLIDNTFEFSSTGVSKVVDVLLSAYQSILHCFSSESVGLELDIPDIKQYHMLTW